MGIIQRQSLKFTIINLLGVVIGICSTLFVYPLITTEFGFIRYLQELALLFLPLMSGGMALSSIRFYPEFTESDRKSHGLLGLVLLVAAVTALLFTIAAIFLWPVLTQYVKADMQHRDLLWLVVPYAIVNMYCTILYNYAQNTHRIAFPSLLVDVLPKFITPIILIAFWKGWIAFETAVFLVLLQMVLSLVGLALFLKRLNAWHLGIDWGFLTNERLIRFFRYGGFVTIFGLVYIMAMRMDVIFLGSMTTLATTGAYAIIVFMVSTMEIPSRGLFMASNAQIPAFWLNHDLNGLENLLSKVSRNLVTIGAGLLILLLVNLKYLSRIMPNGEILHQALPIAAILGIAKLADAAGGMCHAIIYFSNQFKWSLASLGILAVLNLTLGYTLVPVYGALGAAAVTAITIVAFNGFSVLFCRLKWNIRLNLTPLIKCIIAALVAGAIAALIPEVENPFINIALKSGIFILLNGFFIFRFQLAPDLVEMTKGFLKKM